MLASEGGTSRFQPVMREAEADLSFAEPDASARFTHSRTAVSVESNSRASFTVSALNSSVNFLRCRFPS